MVRKTERTYKRRVSDGPARGKRVHTETYRRTTWWFLFAPVYVTERTILVEEF